MLNTLPCHSEERRKRSGCSDEACPEQVEGNPWKVEPVYTCIGSNVLNVSGILRSAQNDISVQSIITHYIVLKFQKILGVTTHDVVRIHFERVSQMSTRPNHDKVFIVDCQKSVTLSEAKSLLPYGQRFSPALAAQVQVSPLATGTPSATGFRMTEN